MTFAEKVKHARTTLKLSQEKFAALLGVSFATVNRWEKGHANHSNSDMSLMNILAYWCNGDKEQMLRIFATSGLFRPNKSADYYEHTAIKALREIPVKSTYTPTIPKNNGGNGKR